ncbi:GIY-YIG nuclease family protein [Herminiimonas fonticola]|uniref:GIY-YIG nuclease family protein n=1 Tax=Herminiimonas fonticola TaxID=303380 RepID=UPI00333E7373
MTWFLYLLECRDGSIYTGIAVDVAARYAAHEKGKGARYTRSHPPRRLLAIVEYADRSTASKAEYAMKRLSAAEKRGFCLQRNGLWSVHLPGAAVDFASRSYTFERISE